MKRACLQSFALIFGISVALAAKPKATSIRLTPLPILILHGIRRNKIKNVSFQLLNRRNILSRLSLHHPSPLSRHSLQHELNPTKGLRVLKILLFQHPIKPTKGKGICIHGMKERVVAL